MIRKLKLAIACTLAIDKAPEIVEKRLNAIEQLSKNKRECQ